MPFPSRDAQVLVLEANRFVLDLKDGRSLPANEVPNQYLLDAHVTITAPWKRTIQSDKLPAFLGIRVAWLLETQSCRPPFKLRFADSEPILVRNCLSNGHSD